MQHAIFSILSSQYCAPRAGSGTWPQVDSGVERIDLLHFPAGYRKGD